MNSRCAIKNSKGFVLIASLVILMALTVMGAIMISTSALETRIAGAERENASAMLLAEAGVSQVREWFQYPERFRPLGSGYSGGITAVSFRDCTALDPATTETSGCGMFGLTSATEQNFFRKRFVEAGKREYIMANSVSAGVGLSQFADTTGVSNTWNVFNPIDTGTDTPALTIENKDYLNSIFGDFQNMGRVTSIRIYPPLSDPRSRLPRPRPICTVRVTAVSLSGVEKTIESEIWESIFLPIDAGAEAGSGAGWNGAGTVNWGEVLVKGNANLNFTQIRERCNGAAARTWPDGDPWYRARVEGTANVAQGAPSATNCADADPANDDCLGCNGINNAPASGGNRPFNNYAVYQGQSVTLDKWDTDLVKSYAQDYGYYYVLDPAGGATSEVVYKADKNGTPTGSPINIKTLLVDTGRDPFLYIDTRTDPTDPASPVRTLNIQASGGGFYTKGDIFVEGHTNVTGGATGRTITAKDPGGTDRTLTGINFEGVIYATGNIGGTGGPAVFGAMVAEGTMQHGGNPTIYYDIELRTGRRNQPRTGKGKWREIM